MMGQSKPAGDQHVFQHVFEGEVRLEIAFDHLWQFHRQCFGITGVVLERGHELFRRDAGVIDQGKGFRQRLNTRAGDDVGSQFDHSGLADLADLDDFCGTRLQNRPRFLQGDFVPGHVKHQLPFFRAYFAAGERRFDKARPAAFHQIGGSSHRVRRDCWMRKHDVPRCQGRRHLPDDVEKRVVVRHENLDVITHLG